MAKAFSYLRFSTPEQAKGDSTRRQSDLARQYAQKHGLDLDESSYRDLGVSGFHGANARTGALGQFLAAVDSGAVTPGSFLLVESLDRVSRQDPWDALPIFQQIINAGIVIVTLQDGRVWSREEIRANPFRMFESLMVMIRAHEESETKSRRLRASWTTKRAKAAVEPLSARGPAWLRLTGDRRWEVIEERAVVVRRVFDLAASGMGEHSIARTLNADAVPTFGDNGRAPAVRWHRSYVSKLLHSPSVVGTLVPHTIAHGGGKKVRTAQQPVAGYYPPVVDLAAFEAVRALQDSANPQRGRHSTAPTQNVLGGLARCAACGATMTRVTKGSSGKAGAPKLVCTAAKTGAGCSYRPARLDAIEVALWAGVAQIAAEGPTSTANDGVATRIEEVKRKIAGFERAHEALLDRAGDDLGAALWDSLAGIVERRTKAEAELRGLEADFAATHGPLIRPRVEALRSSLLSIGDMDRAAVNAAMRQLFSRAVVSPEEGRMVLRWQAGGTSTLMFEVESRTDQLARLGRVSAAKATRTADGSFARSKPPNAQA